MSCRDTTVVITPPRRLTVERPQRQVVVSPSSPSATIAPSPRDLVVEPSPRELVVERYVAREVDLVQIGRQGPPGDGDLHYVHVQAVPAAVWVVVHGLGKRPSVVVVDSSDRVVEGDVRYDSDNQVTLTFSAAFSGKAYVN